jgi:hypothetical protein
MDKRILINGCKCTKNVYKINIFDDQFILMYVLVADVYVFDL